MKAFRGNTSGQPNGLDETLIWQLVEAEGRLPIAPSISQRGSRTRVGPTLCAETSSSRHVRHRRVQHGFGRSTNLWGRFTPKRRYLHGGTATRVGAENPWGRWLTRARTRLIRSLLTGWSFATRKAPPGAGAMSHRVAVPFFGPGRPRRLHDPKNSALIRIDATDHTARQCAV